LIISSCANADDVKFEASLDKKTAAIGDSVQLGLTFYGTQNMPAPDIGNIEGCDIRYLGPSTTMTVINGTVTNSITHMYRIQPLRMGKFQLGPFSFKYSGDSYKSNPVFLTVSEERPKQAQASNTAAGQEDMVESLDLKDRLFLTMKVDKTRAYVNELIPVIIKFYSNNLNVSDIQLPEFNQEGFSKAQFEDPKQTREHMGGLVFDVLEFRTSIFGTRAGDYKIGPATIKCNLVVKKRTRKASPLEDDFMDQMGGGSGQYFDEFFTRYERHPVELKSDEIQLVLSPLPVEGRSADFSGAIGDYQFIFQANPKKAKMGDPVTLKMEINGTGNFNTVIIPKLENTEGFRIYEPQAKTESGRKTFKQVIIPESEKIYQTPKAVFTYFDPNKKEYKSIVQGPFPLEVEKAADTPAQVIGAPQAMPAATRISMGENPPEEKKEEPQGDILYIKELPGRVRARDYKIYNSLQFLLVFLIPAIALIFISVVYAKKDRLSRDGRYAHRTQAFRNMRHEFFELKHRLKDGDTKAFYETLFKTMQNYLGGKFYLPVAGLTFDTVEPILKAKDVDAHITGKINDIFNMCDRVRFASTNIDELKMKDDMKELEEIIRYFERKKI
jgi:hypothetical protein